MQYLSKSQKNNQPTCGALFCGIGGFCLGFESANFKTVWASDFNDQVAKTYQLNFPKTEFFLTDINDIEFNDLHPVDVLHAGFPCQSFSQAGNRSGFSDPRGELFLTMMKMIELATWKPNILVFENSIFLKNGANGEWFKIVKNAIKAAGYWFDDQNAFILSTKQIAGLPQKRERLFLVATNKDFFDFNPFVGINSFHQQKTNIELLDLNAGVDEVYFLSEHNRYGNWILTEGKKLKAGQLLQLRQNTLRPQKENECPTLTANMGLGGHNVPFLVDCGRLRKMTERECLRMQGFPDTFQFPNLPMNAKYRMIGNSVSPMVSAPLAKHIFSELTEQQQIAVEAVNE